MALYETTQTVELFTGKVGLTRAQADRRPGALKPLKKKGWYEILRPVQFKAGERIRLAGVPKGLRQAFEAVKEAEV